jgi:hypothetical protein
MYLYAIIGISMSSSITYEDNKGQESVEVQAEADIPLYSAILTDQYGLDYDLVNNFENQSKILNNNPGNLIANCPFLAAARPEAILGAIDHPHTKHYAHIN